MLLAAGVIAAMCIAASCSDEPEIIGPAGNGNDSIDVTPDLVPLDTLYESFGSFYPDYNYGPLCEWSSDNIIDNNSVNISTLTYDTVSYSLPEFTGYEWLGNVFAFEPVGGDVRVEDSPYFIANNAYIDIEHINQFIYQAERVGTDSVVPAYADELPSMVGEARVLRAYIHFVLVNIFAPGYNDYGKGLRGIECSTEPGVKQLMTVEETYALIEDDLERGISAMRDNGFPQSVWRFNERACYAFAARFYLYRQDYDKVVDYATRALGPDPSAVMTDWRKFEGYTTVADMEMVWHQENEPSIFMMLDTYSLMMRLLCTGCRYAFNGSALDGTFSYSPICTLNIPPYMMAAGLLVNGEQKYGLMSCKVMEHFEYIDTVANIGYPKVMRNEFTAEETLLCRAEANLMLGNIDEAMADMDVWGLSKQGFSYDCIGRGDEPASNFYNELTMDVLREFYLDQMGNNVTSFCSVNYDNSVYCDMLANLSTTGVPSLDEDETYLLRYILHSRRLETVHDGLRFFDLKRLNIDYKHWIGNDGNMMPAREEVLTYDDPRRALTMPDLSADDEAADSLGSKVYRLPRGMSPILPIPMSGLSLMDNVQ